MHEGVWLRKNYFWQNDSCENLDNFSLIRPGAKYFEKYSNTLQLLWIINDYNYITITGPVEM